MVLPAGTVFEEGTLVTKGDVILGDRVKLGFGIHTDGRIFCGQGAEVDGDVTADGDVRLDQSSHVLGDAKSGGNVYLGERVFVKGDLAVEGDLDVGDDVRVGGQLKAKGWVQKRNPVPLVIYLFIYILELMRLGHSKEVERILEELEETEGADIAVSEIFLFIPQGSEVGLQDSDIKGGLAAGDDCRILGNLRVEGDVRLGDGSRVLGALRGGGDVHLGTHIEVQGEVVAAGKVVVGTGCTILGDLKATSVEMFPEATVDGKIVAADGVKFRTAKEAAQVAKQKVDEFAGKAADLVDLLS